MSALASFLAASAQRHPRRAALVLKDRALTYSELRRHGQRAAAALSDSGVGSGGCVAAVCRSMQSLAWIACGASWLGAALLPLNPALSPARRDRLRTAAGADLTLADHPREGIAPWPPFAGAFAENQATDMAPAALQPDAIELIIATSGSGGDPKGVMLSSRNLEASVGACAAVLPLAPGDVWLACLPLHHIGGMAIVYRCAAAGATLVLHEGFDPEAVLADLKRRRVSHISLVPAMLARLLDRSGDGAPPESLRCALAGGGELSVALLRRARRAGWPVMPTYGLSEACSQVATLRSPPENWRAGDVGHPLPGVAVQIADGRIRVRGATVMAGYANPRRRSGQGVVDGWFETSDLGRMDADGRLTVLGRDDDVLVSGGVNVHPAQVEEVLAACPGVAAVAVTGRKHEVWGDQLVALVQGGASPQALDAWCRERLPAALRPREYLRVDALPHTPMGKLDRRGLKRLAQHARPGPG